MKTRKNLIGTALLIAGLLLPQLSNAQKLTQKSTDIKVEGTAPGHDWTMVATQSSFTGTVNGNAITGVKFVMKANALKSEKKSETMDEKALKSMQASKYPDITFTTESIPTSGGTVSGNLTITNVTKNVKIPVTVTKSGNTYIIKGKVSVKMTDYKVTPPTFLGFIKTGDDVTININLTVTN